MADQNTPIEAKLRFNMNILHREFSALSKAQNAYTCFNSLFCYQFTCSKSTAKSLISNSSKFRDVQMSQRWAVGSGFFSRCFLSEASQKKTTTLPSAKVQQYNVTIQGQYSSPRQCRNQSIYCDFETKESTPEEYNHLAVCKAFVAVILVGITSTKIATNS